MHRRYSRAHRRQSVAPDTFNLASKKKKKTWKVVVEPEFNDDDDEDELAKGTDYEKKPFDGDQIYQLISDTVKKIFVTGDEDGEKKAYVYVPTENVNLCQQISKDIRNELKTWKHLMRYRIIVLTTIVEKQHQGIHYRMKSLADPKTDNFVKYYLDNPNFYVIVCVMLIYQD